MKKIEAIIRPEKLNDVLTALYRIDVKGLTVTRVQGHGGEMEQVETYRGGKTGVLGFFVGQIMKATRGQANPKVVNELLRKKLG